jgi:hypothetical protein
MMKNVLVLSERLGSNGNQVEKDELHNVSTLAVPLACTEFSWESIDGCLRPTYCTLPPAPEALLSLRKCSCSSGCKTNACGCVKNKLVCTDLCQCVDNCKNIEDSRLTTAEDDDYDDCGI